MFVPCSEFSHRDQIERVLRIHKEAHSPSGVNAPGQSALRERNCSAGAAIVLTAPYMTPAFSIAPGPAQQFVAGKAFVQE